MLPIKIFIFEYPIRNLSLASTVLEESILVLLALCQLFNPLKVIELDTFYPEYLNLSKDRENDWIVYADKVKEIMLRAKDRLKTSNSGYGDVIEFIQNLKAKNSYSKTEEKEDFSNRIVSS